ncbi:MAG: pyridoxal phosphate-dependent aminotransferase [Byssovorax sp.]
MAPSIAARAQQMPASPIRKLMPLAEAAKRRGVRVIHLNIGQPDLPTPAPMRARLSDVPEVLAYTPSNGTPEYLGMLLRYYAGLGIALEEREILATSGGSEALLFAMIACGDVGAEALVVEPFYTNYNAFATMAGVRLQPLTSRGEDGFHLPPRLAWEAAITPATRMVILCNPNNPTGTVYTRDELEMVAAFCRDHQLFLISDEVYRELAYDGRAAVSALSLVGIDDLTVVVDSLSKRYSACGIRLGSLITRNREIHEAGLRMGQGRLSAPGLAQLAALGAEALDPGYFAANTAIYQRRRDVLFQGLSAIPGVFLRKPEGAFYFIARLPLTDSEDFCRFLLEDFAFEGRTVMLAPAPGFYATPGLGHDEVRIAYVLNEADLEDAVKILAAGLAAYHAPYRV